MYLLLPTYPSKESYPVKRASLPAPYNRLLDTETNTSCNPLYFYRKNYKIVDFKEEKLGKYDVYVISLEATTSLPAYEKSDFYIRKDIPLLLKKTDFSASGRLMRTSLIPKYAKTEKGYIGYQQIMRDELNPGEQTQLILSDLSFEPLPDRIFTKAYLEGLN